MKRCLNKKKQKRYAKAGGIKDVIKHWKQNFYIRIAVAIAVVIGSIAGWHLMVRYGIRDDIRVKYREIARKINSDFYRKDLYLSFMGNSDSLLLIVAKSETLRDLDLKARYQCDDSTYSVYGIHNQAFRNCEDVQTIKIDDGIEPVGSYAFGRCVKVLQLIFPNSVTAIGRKACFHMSDLEQVLLPDSLKRIKDGTFIWCVELEKIEVPSGVESIEVQSFAYCRSLKDVSLPEGLKEIGPKAFMGCRSMQEFTIPSTVSFIGSYTLWDCDSLKHIYNYAIEPQSVSEICNSDDIILHVPAASVMKYRKADYWKELNIKGDI